MVVNAVSIVANTLVLNVADQQDKRLGQMPRNIIFGCLSGPFYAMYTTAAKGGTGKVEPMEEGKKPATDCDGGQDRKESSGQMGGDTDTKPVVSKAIDDHKPESDMHDIWQQERINAGNILDRWFFVVFLLTTVACTILSYTIYN